MKNKKNFGNLNNHQQWAFLAAALQGYRFLAKNEPGRTNGVA